MALTAIFVGTIIKLSDIVSVITTDSRHSLVRLVQDDTEEAESHVMTSHRTEDKQLQAITLASVLEKRRLDQALNAKEFAVCAGVSYSTARSWFHLSGFPVFHGVIFWKDFVEWRTNQNGLTRQSDNTPRPDSNSTNMSSSLPPRAAQILHNA
jgi:hypothetical protein